MQNHPGENKEGKARRQHRWRLPLIVCGVALTLVVVSMRFGVEVLSRNRCRAKLERLGEAFRRYRDVHGSFPPASIHDVNGHPLHSWRVLIVPYLEANWFYGSYDLNEPWNGPKNRLLLREYHEEWYGETVDITDVREVYRCPAAAKSRGQFCTNYVMLVDPYRPMVPLQQLAQRSVSQSDATSEWQARLPSGGEILVVELDNSSIHWMEPRDLSIEEMSFLINDSRAPSISSQHIGGAFVLLANGTVEFLDDDTTEERLREMVRNNRPSAVP